MSVCVCVWQLLWGKDEAAADADSDVYDGVDCDAVAGGVWRELNANSN